MISPAEDGTDRLIRLSEVKQRVGLGKTKIYGMIAEGRFPKPYKISSAAARWSAREIDAWIANIRQDFAEPTR
jgi:prophage regulatory protein